MSDIPDTGRLKQAQQGVLVIANSGRMLANAVRSAGYISLVIDLFADQDTEQLAEQVWQVKNMSLAVIREVVQKLLLSYKIQWVIYGSGLENHPETLEYLAGHFCVTGNDFSVIKQLVANRIFFKRLDSLNIAHPEVQFYPPINSADWLIKPTNHVGGIGISWCRRSARDDEYYQKFCQGEAGSVLFCADGEQFTLIGFHRQWTVTHDNFAFAGIMTDACLAVEHQKTVCEWLKKLVSYFRLTGLASLDFIYNNTGCYFLEINPRPPASMMLYPELDLLTAHRTGRINITTEAKLIRAIQIVYAKQQSRIQQGIDWPEWSFDRPKCKTSIQVDEPVCSIMAQGSTVEQTFTLLKSKQIHIENIILNR
ncbi:hypothetical protein AU255_06955 [Methyloprofundus sedimenti]|uniref:ATP-grasp domain-containing protein n=1 Tax=Methyloprofundus sedimenti TaxID=1420851 RepID=A0A1V8M7Q1_9GAMM|nr:ATP-grasp domain-containing protein [Methyloprofundus sedimenti]OQK17600.1 hypothetical protein AU255_06955 [Methyloprofundus sedimenti]